ncbi:MAG TPA: hypothetical protein VFP21_08625 [Solirubrobacterales bacterium]|nr:hypothetical protein [Solirubrobacterales bacterium]
MKKNGQKKLVLSKDTLRNLNRGLEGQELKEAVGNGFTFISDCSARVTCSC